MDSPRDPAARDLLGGGPRRWPFVVAAVTALLVVTGVVAMVVLLARGDSEGPVVPVADPSLIASAAPTTSPRPSSAPSTDDPAPDGEEALQLPQPSGYENGVPVGYPRTLAGAVGAAYGYSRVATGLDVEQVVTAVEFIADPDAAWFEQSREELADSLVQQRAGLGLPAVGSTQSAAITVTPSSYQVAKQSPDQMTVLTLNVVSTTSADGAQRGSGVIVFRWALRWDGDRWRAVEIYIDDRDSDLAVTPLTSEARSKGWKVARGG